MILMKQFFLTLFLLLGAFTASAQSAQEQANIYYDNKEYDKALPIYKQYAENGDTVAQFRLANCYYFNNNYTQAAYWVRKAAEQGHPTAMNNLGACYNSGKGVAKDYSQAVYWYRKAAEQGEKYAQNNLGSCYENGQGVTRDYTKAVFWYRKAAEQGDATAQNNLGRCYYNGKGVKKDYPNAVYWYRKAAEQGEKYAQNNLGFCYENGKGVTKDLTEAGKWYKLAADNGNEGAKGKYMELYAKGYLSEKIPNAQSATPSSKEKKTELAQNGSSAAIDTDIPVTGASQPKTFAIIIGNENYNRVAKVPFAINDAEVFAEYCTKTLGLPSENVSIYTDVTYGNLLGAIKRMKNIAVAYNGDINLIFYYAGHGIPDDASKQANILPIDADGTIKDSCYPLAKLYSALATTNARRIIVFLDACFSGSERGDGMLSSSRGVIIKPVENVIEGNMVVFSAVSGEQTAFPYKTMNHGLFTYYLLDKIKETRGKITLGELCEYVSNNVKQRSILINNKLQTPTITHSESLANSWKSITLR